LGEPSANLERGLALMKQAAADLIVLPELSNSGYNFQSPDELDAIAEEIPGGPTLTAWMRASRETGTWIIGGLAERAGGVYFNTAVAVGPEGLVARYRKAHLYGNEPRWFQPGDTPFPVFRVGEAVVGMMICFDWAFPEAARVLALQGADLICVPANIAAGKGYPESYAHPGMVARSVENRVFSILTNRVGCEGEGPERLRYVGRSQVVGPDGSILASGGEADECAMAVEVDLSEAKDKRLRGISEMFAIRRPDLYGRIVGDR
jgi:predicted amidohydrolase